MQLIEVSMTGMRSAVITLRSRKGALSFVLFPMFHMGTEEFYRQVANRLGHCDLVVAEGISGRPPVVLAALTLGYRLPSRRRRLGLVEERIDLASLGVPVIRPDMTATEFSEGWQSVPTLQRAFVLWLVPLVAAWFWLVGSRRMLSRYAAIDDVPTLLESQVRDKMPELTDVIVDRRDGLLIAALDAIHGQHSDEPMAVGVIYGAGHMAAVVHHLAAAYGYRPREADWLTVFDF